MRMLDLGPPMSFPGELWSSQPLEAKSTHSGSDTKRKITLFQTDPAWSGLYIPAGGRGHFEALITLSQRG